MVLDAVRLKQATAYLRLILQIQNNEEVK
jgi:hypothetical protein